MVRVAPARPTGRRLGRRPTTSSRAPGVALKPIAKVSGVGPTGELIELAGLGGVAMGGRTGSLPAHRVARTQRGGSGSDRRTRRSGVPRPPTHAACVRLPPARVAATTASSSWRGPGHALVLVPSARHGPAAWSQAAPRRHRRCAVSRRMGAPFATASVAVGTRAAAWAPVPDLSLGRARRRARRGLATGAAPTWHARDVVVERARRAECRACWSRRRPRSRRCNGVSWSRCRATRSAQGGRCSTSSIGATSRPVRRCSRTRWRECCAPTRGWCACSTARAGRGCWRARRAASWLGARPATPPVAQADEGELVCSRCGTRRPTVVPGLWRAASSSNLRAGVTAVREELEALARRPVVEVTGRDATMRCSTEARSSSAPRRCCTA